MPAPIDMGLPVREIDRLTDADLIDKLAGVAEWRREMVPRWASHDEFDRLMSIWFSAQQWIVRDAVRAAELGNPQRACQMLRKSEDYLWNSRRTIRDDRLRLHRLYAITGERRVKIGITSDLNNRMKDLQRGCPLELELFATAPGDFFTEQYIHLILREYQVRGEWYWFVPAVKAVILKHMTPVAP